jgi:hypothetical protein
MIKNQFYTRTMKRQITRREVRRARAGVFVDGESMVNQEVIGSLDRRVARFSGSRSPLIIGPQVEGRVRNGFSSYREP